jgi:hypothetical protein
VPFDLSLINVLSVCILQCFQKVAMHLQKVFEVMSTSVCSGPNRSVSAQRLSERTKFYSLDLRPTSLVLKGYVPFVELCRFYENTYLFFFFFFFFKFHRLKFLKSPDPCEILSDFRLPPRCR